MTDQVKKVLINFEEAVLKLSQAHTDVQADLSEANECYGNAVVNFSNTSVPDDDATDVIGRLGAIAKLCHPQVARLVEDVKARFAARVAKDY